MCNNKKGSCGNCQWWMPYEGERTGLCLRLYEMTSFDEHCGEYSEDVVVIDKNKEEKDGKSICKDNQ